jgi:hypothetical protein
MVTLRTVSVFCTRRMDGPAPNSTGEGTGELRRKLQGDLEGLKERRSGLERELEAVDKEIEAKQCALELVEVNKKQLAVQGRGQPHVEGSEQRASTQVRGSVKLQDIGTSPFGLTCGSCVCCCDSPRRQRLLASAPVLSPLASSRTASPFPRLRTSLRRCGRTTCCRWWRARRRCGSEAHAEY